MSRKKGNRTRRKCIDYFEDKGYIVDKVEKTHRFAQNKDLFGAVCEGFDLIALKPDEVILIQVKTNQPAPQETYKEFAEKYANDIVKILVATWYDYKDWRFQWYQDDGTIIEEDLRE